MLLSDFSTVKDWFYVNFMILNPGKCYFISIGKDTHDEDVFYYDNLILKNSDEEDILGVTIDRKLTFHQHTKKLCRKAGQKLSALLRLSPYLDKQYTLLWSNLSLITVLYFGCFAQEGQITLLTKFKKERFI